MNTPDVLDTALAARARALHDEALDNLSPRVQAQLAQRRRLASQGSSTMARRRVLPWAGVATAAVALALVMLLQQPSVVGTAPTNLQARVSTPLRSIASVESAAPGDEVTVLSEDPDFYLWLAANGRPANVE